MAKNEIVVTTDEHVNNYVGGTAEKLSAFLQGEINLSPLAVGTKFDSDDLVKADYVKLKEFDWVEYVENEGTEKERNVRFALWAIDVQNGEKVEQGYYQGGIILNKIATAIGKSEKLLDDFNRFGVIIKCEWGKTSSKNDILLVKVL